MNEIMMKPVCTNCGHILKKVVQENERLDPLEGERIFLKLATHSFYPQRCPKCGMIIRGITYQRPVDCDSSTIYYDEPKHEYTLKDRPEPEIHEPGFLDGCDDIFHTILMPHFVKHNSSDGTNDLCQKCYVMINYSALSNMYTVYKDSKDKDWQWICKWISSLPYSELITSCADN